MSKVDLNSMALSDVSLIRLVTKDGENKEYIFTSSTDFEAEEIKRGGRICTVIPDCTRNGLSVFVTGTQQRKTK